MFEVTFSGGWPATARVLVEEISGFWALWWIIYITLVWFAVIRVISALFLKQTMSVANIDAEKMAVDKMREKETIAKQLYDIFVSADTSGDGLICRDEFEAMIVKHDVVRYFEKLELEVFEVVALFEMVSEDDGVADYEEFLQGAFHL